MSNNKKQYLNDYRSEELDINGNPIDPDREYIGNKVKIPMASPNSSIYKSNSTIIIRGNSISSFDKGKSNFLEFIKRAPISFDDNDE